MQIKRVKSNEDFTKEEQNLGKIIDFFSKTNDLQKTQRYGDYPDFSESTADHTFKVVLIVDYLYKYLNLDLDYQKCIELAIYHDFGEIDLKQDVDIKGNAQTRIKRIKDEYENKKIKELTNKYYSSIGDYNNEYKDKTTAEARFVNACDKIEGMIHPLTVNKPIMNHELFANYADKAINNFPKLMPIYRIIKDILKEKYLLWGFEWKKEYEEIFQNK